MPESPPHNSSRTKRALIDAGFEVFRARGEEIIIAERPRENLIMDSGVRLRLGDATNSALEVRVVLRAQKADFPADDDAQLFDRVRRLAASTLSDGFVEVATAVTRVPDPGDSEQTLDTHYEMTFSKRTALLDDALVELRLALGIEKRA
jgi:hypothetical protein